MQPTALITGGNRGIGFEVARQLGQKGVRVILTSRDDAAGKAAAEKLTAEGAQVTHERLDVTRDDSARALATRLAARLEAAHEGLDILVNNAGAMHQGFNADIARDTVETNFFGPLRVTEALLPHLRPGARIVMVSSGLADRNKLGPALKERFHQPFTRDEIVAHMRRFVDAVAAGEHAAEGWPSSAYVVSKLGLNALTDHLARELDADGRGILCNAVCPGWVRTDMGGPSAHRSVEEGADTPVWLATAPEHRHQGGIYRDRKPVSW